MFIKHNLQPRDLNLGHRLTDLQIKVLQNRAIELAEELLSVSPTTTDNYEIKFSYLQGQLHEIKSMISISEQLAAKESQDSDNSYDNQGD